MLLEVTQWPGTWWIWVAFCCTGMKPFVCESTDGWSPPMWWKCFLSNLWAKWMCSSVSCSPFTRVSFMVREKVGIFASCMGCKRIEWNDYHLKTIMCIPQVKNSLTNGLGFTFSPFSCLFACSESFLCLFLFSLLLLLTSVFWFDVKLQAVAFLCSHSFGDDRLLIYDAEHLKAQKDDRSPGWQIPCPGQTEWWLDYHAW